MSGRGPRYLSKHVNVPITSETRQKDAERDRDLVEVLAIKGEFAPMQLVLSTKK